MSNAANGERILARKMARELSTEELAQIAGQTFPTWWDTYYKPNGDHTTTEDSL